jgi:hypothetical protein
MGLGKGTAGSLPDQNEKSRPGRRLFKGIGRVLTWLSEFDA